MKSTIEKALRDLIGKVLLDAGRTVNLVWFQFGNTITTPIKNNEEVDVNEYLLHIQCAWRLTYKKSVLVASRDLFYPKGDPYQDTDDFDWTIPNSNRCDERLGNVFTLLSPDQLIVRSVKAESFGGFKLRMNKNVSIDIFPDTSLESEYWRLFQPNQESDHFVVTGKGIEKADEDFL